MIMLVLGIVITAAAVLMAGSMFFDRNPERAIPPGENVIVSPADGRVVYIRRVEEAGSPQESRRILKITVM
jgi:phosphatidylserine decarboxylase